MTRDYGQSCGVALALDLLGERWTLLVLRDLCAGPHTFTQLLRSLTGIGPNLLSTRLARLQAAALVASGEQGYRLTATGQGLRPLLRELLVAGHWLALDEGGKRGTPARTALAVAFDPLLAGTVALQVEARVGTEHFSAFVGEGRLAFMEGAPPTPANVFLDATEDGFRRALRGERSADFRLRGDATALRAFREVFAVPLERPARIVARWADH